MVQVDPGPSIRSSLLVNKIKFIVCGVVTINTDRLGLDERRIQIFVPAVLPDASVLARSNNGAASLLQRVLKVIDAWIGCEPTKDIKSVLSILVLVEHAKSVVPLAGLKVQTANADQIEVILARKEHVAFALHSSHD
jgi:hypothetical protein